MKDKIVIDEPLYCEYHKIYQKFKQASRKYDKILEDKAMLYFNTQPKATNLTKEIVSGGRTTNKFMELVEKLEKLDIELQQARNERDLKNYLLKKKELEIRESKEILDKIYVYRYIEKKKVKHIARDLIYSYQRIYQLLDEINEKIRKN